MRPPGGSKGPGHSDAAQERSVGRSEACGGLRRPPRLPPQRAEPHPPSPRAGGRLELQGAQGTAAHDPAGADRPAHVPGVVEVPPLHAPPPVRVHLPRGGGGAHRDDDAAPAVDVEPDRRHGVGADAGGHRRRARLGLRRHQVQLLCRERAPPAGARRARPATPATAARPPRPPRAPRAHARRTAPRRTPSQPVHTPRADSPPHLAAPGRRGSRARSRCRCSPRAT